MDKTLLKLGVIICYSFMVINLLIACLIMYVGEPAGEALNATFQFFALGLLINILVELKHPNGEKDQ